MFVQNLMETRLLHACAVLDFVVMDNHIHLILDPGSQSGLSAIMKRILGVFALRYNRAFESWGHVWGDRYFARPIDGLAALQTTIEYVDRNPVRAGLADKPEEWRWGGLFCHRQGDPGIQGPPPPWLVLVSSPHARLGLGEGVGDRAERGQTPALAEQSPVTSP